MTDTTAASTGFTGEAAVLFYSSKHHRTKHV
jgi:hypothetical protein